MDTALERSRRRKLFMMIALSCVVLAVGYTAWAILQERNGTARVQEDPQGAPLPIASPDELAAIQSGPHLVFIQEAEPYIGKVRVVGLDSESPRRAQTELGCGRVHYAAGSGLCLAYDASSDFVWVTVFGKDFQPRHQFTTEGVISRTRVSPDGKYAAFTVFVSGHSYDDANMSTATVLLDTATGETLGNLEEFEAWKDGAHYQAPEFNFWGVTFAQDSNTFYATLRNGNKTYLVQGDVAARTLTVLHENVECPSLSPDGTRIAFKKLLPGRWQLTVLDLATMKETPLAEEESIDDQVEWLDNERILYQKVDYDPPRWVSVFVLPADGSGKPEVFIPNATSPVVVR